MSKRIYEWLAEVHNNNAWDWSYDVTLDLFECIEETMKL